MDAAWLGIYALSFATGLAVGVLACLAWRGGTSAVAYWVRVFFGSLTAGIIAGGGALGGGGSPPLTDARPQLPPTKGTLMAPAPVPPPPRRRPFRRKEDPQEGAAPKGRFAAPPAGPAGRLRQHDRGTGSA